MQILKDQFGVITLALLGWRPAGFSGDSLFTDPLRRPMLPNSIDLQVLALALISVPKELSIDGEIFRG